MNELASNEQVPVKGVSYPGLSRLSLIVGLAGVLVAAFGLVFGVLHGEARPVFGWLIGLSYWLDIGVGMLFIVMIFYLFDAGWPVVIRRQLEHALGGFKWLFVLFLPLLIIGWGGLGDDPGLLWKWMNPEKLVPGGHTVAEDGLYQHKAAYLNLEFFTIRVVLFFMVWVGLAGFLRMCSYRLDSDPNLKWASWPRRVSAVGVPLCAFATTFAAVDWYMSIEYHWFSTMYGVWFFAEGMRSAFAMMVVMLFVLETRGYLKGLVNRAHYYFIGCLMLAFTMFWAYISFSQYFLIYSANIPEETFWYQLRELTLDGEKSNWWWVSMALIFGQFLVPFLALLWYKTKVIPKRLLAVAVWMLAMHLIDIYWNVLPGKTVDGEAKFGYVLRPFDVTLWDVAMLIGVGGLMLWSFLRNAAAHKPIPIRDPRILESIHAHE